MPTTVELTVPDLGGFEDVPIIEILIASGDTIGVDAPLVTLESDKATMEVPATAAGIVRNVKVKIGDRVSPGSVLADVEVAGDASPAGAANGKSTAAPASSASANEAAELAEPESASGGGSAGAQTAGPAAVKAAESKTTPGGFVDLVVPDLGGFDDIPVITVFVKAGDAVNKDAPLVELESDKATMEVPASEAGTISAVLVKVGDKVSPGTVLARIGSAASATAPAPPAPPPPAAAPPPMPNSQPAGANDKPESSPPRPEPALPAPALAAIVAPAPPSQNGSSNGAAGGPLHASPAIRRFARELGVDLGGVKGSGPNGRITRDDVQNYVKRTLAAPPPAAVHAPAQHTGGLQLLPWPKLDFERFGPVERTPLSRIAKLSGPNLARNWAMIPHVTQFEDADVTELEAFRKAINADQKDVKVTMLALLMKALVAALREFPTFNSSLDGDELILKRYFHLGFAADTPNGLVVPVLRDADKKGILEIALETSALAKKARDGKLGPAEMTGAGFTISSLGGIGGTAFTPIINAPEVAIIGVSRTVMKPVWDGAAFVPRLILPLSLSYDHRVIDGALAARFITYLAGLLADIRKTLL